MARPLEKKKFLRLSRIYVDIPTWMLETSQISIKTRNIKFRDSLKIGWFSFNSMVSWFYQREGEGCMFRKGCLPKNKSGIFKNIFLRTFRENIISKKNRDNFPQEGFCKTLRKFSKKVINNVFYLIFFNSCAIKEKYFFLPFFATAKVSTTLKLEGGLGPLKALMARSLQNTKIRLNQEFIWDEGLVPGEYYQGENPLALPKLNLQAHMLLNRYVDT